MPPGWNDWHTVIGDARLFYGYKINDNGVVSDPHGNFDESTSTYPEKDSPSCPNNPPPLQECNYLTDLITQDALNAITSFGANPFYLQVDYTTPHGDIVPPGGPEPAPRHAGTFPGAKAPRLPSFNERDIGQAGFRAPNTRLGFGKIDYIDRRYQTGSRRCARLTTESAGSSTSWPHGRSPTPTSFSSPTTAFSGRAPLRLRQVPAL